MLEGLLPPPVLDLLHPDAVSPALLALVSDEAPNRMILCAGAGGIEQARIGITEGIFVGRREDAPEEILRRLGEITDPQTLHWAQSSAGQGEIELRKAGFDLPSAIGAKS